MAKLHYEFEEGISVNTVERFLRMRVLWGALVLIAVNVLLVCWSPLVKKAPPDVVHRSAVASPGYAF